MLKKQRINALLIIVSIIVACSMAQGCDNTRNSGKGVDVPMKSHYIGRFVIAVPTDMKPAVLTASLRYVKIDEILWPRDIVHEQARNAEWNKFMAHINELSPPIHTDKVVLRIEDFHGVCNWARGIFYHKNGDAADEATWSMLADTGMIALWLKGDSTLVEYEFSSNRMADNIKNILRNYNARNVKNFVGQQLGNNFYLQHGRINLPYLEQEESYARFEGHPLSLVLEIKMEMDVGYHRETVGLIEKTKGMLVQAAIEPGISISKIRLDKRQVAGMKGEEAILRMSDKDKTTYMFIWEFNGREDSGEYPTTTIEMESPDGNRDEKIKIWDAVLDSMKPMFVRKK